MDPQILVFVFLLAGVLLIFAELFLPSGGAIAVMCVCSFLVSGYYAYQSWYVQAPVFWWAYVAGVVLLIPASIIGAFQLLSRTSLGQRIILPAPTLEEVTPYQAEQARLEAMIGQRGKAIGLMTPGGMVMINGERLHATAEGLMVESDAPVEVVAVRGNRIVVRAVPEEAGPQSPFEKMAETQPDPVDPWELEPPESR